MTFASRFAAALLLVVSVGISPGQSVVENWQINYSNCAMYGNSWLAAPNPGHSIDYIPKNAEANYKRQNMIVLLTGEGATAPLRFLDPATGHYLYSFATTPTGDTFREHSRMATSEDGYIFVSSFGGVVQRYNVDGEYLGEIVTSSMYSSITGACRSIAVTGSYRQNNLKIFVGKGDKVAVFASSTTGFVSLLGSVSTGVTGDVLALAAYGNRLYAASSMSPQVRTFILAYAPFVYNGPTFIDFFNTRTKTGMDITPNQSRLALLQYGGVGYECAATNIDIAGTGLTNISALSYEDVNGNGIYDGGPNRTFFTIGATPDVCIEPDGKTLYGYAPHSEPSPTAQSPAVFKLTVSASPVSEWMIY